MNASLLCALLSVFAVSSAAAAPALAAASTDGSLPADIAAIPLCEQEVLSKAGLTLSKNDRKLLCQKTLKVDELLKIPPTDTTTLKAMCDTVSCTAALKELYKTLPNCRYLDWAFKLSVENRLEFCGIDPESLAAAGSAGAAAVTVGADNSTTTKPPATWNASASSGAGGSEFAPVEAPTSAPVPVTTAPATAVPTTTPKSAGSTLYTATATAAMVVAAVAAVAL